MISSPRSRSRATSSRPVAVDRSVHRVRGRDAELVQHLEQPPQTDALPVVAPAEIALRLRRARRRDVVADAGAERKVLDADRDVEREPFALRPTVVRPRADGGVLVSIVMRQLHRSAYSLPGTMPGGSDAQWSAICPGSVNQTRSRLRMVDDVAQRFSEQTEPERLAHRHRMQRDGAHQRLIDALLDHLVELIDDHVREIARALLAKEERDGVVDFERVGDAEYASGARLHPERLVVAAPVHQEFVARFLQHVDRDRRVRHARAHPAVRAAARKRASMREVASATMLRFVVLPHRALPLRLRAAVPDDLVAPRAHPLHEVGAMRADEAAHVVRGRKLQLFEQIEEPPHADAMAVVAPRVVALRLAGGGPERRIGSRPGAESEILDVRADIEREPLAARPVVGRTAIDHRVLVARVMGRRARSVDLRAGVLDDLASTSRSRPSGTRQLVGRAADQFEAEARQAIAKLGHMDRLSRYPR